MRTLSLSPTLVARVFSAVIACAILFQLALAAGLPWGSIAWGGAFPGVLPLHMRFASVGSAALLFLFAVVVQVRAGTGQSKWKSASRKLIWVVVVYSGLGVIANTMTPSFWERVIWVPVTLLLLASSLVVAKAR